MLQEDGGLRGMLQRAGVDLSKAIAPPGSAIVSMPGGGDLSLPKASIGDKAATVEGVASASRDAVTAVRDAVPAASGAVATVGDARGPIEEVEDERGLWFPLEHYPLVEAQLKRYKRNILNAKGTSVVPARTLLSFRWDDDVIP